MKKLEEWNDIKNYEGIYKVSNKGNVKSIPRIDANGVWREEKILKPILAKSGYLVVGLSKNGKEKQYRIHRLVAEAFIPNPNSFSCINHKDEDRTNNCVENLEWCTIGYNNNYGNRIKKVIKSMGKPIIAITPSNGSISFYPSISIASRETNSSRRHISGVLKGKRNYHNGRKWRYATEQEIKEAYEMAGEKF